MRPRLCRFVHGMIAYTGTYQLKGNQWVTRVDAAWNPQWVGTEQTRYFLIEGDKLVVQTPWRVMPNWPEKGLTRSIVCFNVAGDFGINRSVCVATTSMSRLISLRFRQIAQIHDLVPVGKACSSNQAQPTKDQTRPEPLHAARAFCAAMVLAKQALTTWVTTTTTGSNQSIQQRATLHPGDSHPNRGCQP